MNDEILKVIRELDNPEIEALASLVIINLVKKYMPTTTPTVEEVNAKQPLFLPHGSIRAIISLLLLLVSAGSFILNYQLPQEFYAITILAIGYYIGYRTNNTQLPIIKN